MKNFLLRYAVCLCILSCSGSALCAEMFSGTWCISYLRLILSFKGKDSIYVSNMKQGKITNAGKGVYSRNDSIITATVVNANETELKMSYLYKINSKTSIKAKVLYFIVDKDTAERPDKWIRMEQCNPQSYKGWITETPKDTVRKTK